MTRSVVVSALVALGCIVSAAPAQEPATVYGFTQPSARRTFAFESPGIVAKVLVKEGDTVAAGQVLAEQESRADQKELEVRRIDAESDVEIESAKKEYELRKLQYDRRMASGENVDDTRGFSRTEIEEARITMELAALKVREAEYKKQQAQAVYERQGIKVELMKLVSDVPGIVEKINVDPGEMADPQKPEGTVSVVTNETLWIEIPLMKNWQAAKLAQLAKNQSEYTLQVRYLIDKPDAWQPAKLIFISPVADARSGTQLVRLELKNPQNLSSGLDVEVKLPPELLVDPTATTASGTATNN